MNTHVPDAHTIVSMDTKDEIEDVRAHLPRTATEGQISDVQEAACGFGIVAEPERERLSITLQRNQFFCRNGIALRQADQLNAAIGSGVDTEGRLGIGGQRQRVVDAVLGELQEHRGRIGHGGRLQQHIERRGGVELTRQQRERVKARDIAIFITSWGCQFCGSEINSASERSARDNKAAVKFVIFIVLEEVAIHRFQ